MWFVSNAYKFQVLFPSFDLYVNHPWHVSIKLGRSQLKWVKALLSLKEIYFWKEKVQDFFMPIKWYNPKVKKLTYVSWLQELMKVVLCLEFWHSVLFDFKVFSPSLRTIYFTSCEPMAQLHVNFMCPHCFLRSYQLK